MPNYQGDESIYAPIPNYLKTSPSDAQEYDNLQAMNKVLMDAAIAKAEGMSATAEAAKTSQAELNAILREIQLRNPTVENGYGFLPIRTYLEGVINESTGQVVNQGTSPKEPVTFAEYHDRIAAMQARCKRIRDLPYNYNHDVRELDIRTDEVWAGVGGQVAAEVRVWVCQIVENGMALPPTGIVPAERWLEDIEAEVNQRVAYDQMVAADVTPKVPPFIQRGAVSAGSVRYVTDPVTGKERMVALDGQTPLDEPASSGEVQELAARLDAALEVISAQQHQITQLIARMQEPVK